MEENEGPIVTIGGRKCIMAGSNNYLGLTSHPFVKESAIKAIEKYGSGCSGSRYLTGTLDLHQELEYRLAKFLGTESVLLFSTGFQTALGVIAGLAGKGDYVISDKENHASILTASLLAKGSFAELVRFRHNDMDDLEQVLSKIPDSAGKLVVTDGIFSVTGEVCNLPEIVRISKKYGARVLVDDAHATGVIGDGGRGTASHYNLVQETDLVMGTFSKTFASLGGFVGGNARVIDFLKHQSPALIFSASPTPASCAAAIAALTILEEQPELVEVLRKNTDFMRNGFKELGFKYHHNISGIVPIVVGDEHLALHMWNKLFEKNIFVNAFIPPAAPVNHSMMRTSYMATHQHHHLEEVLSAFELVGKEMNLLQHHNSVTPVHAN